MNESLPQYNPENQEKQENKDTNMVARAGEYLKYGCLDKEKILQAVRKMILDLRCRIIE